MTIWTRASCWDEFFGKPTTSFSSETGFIAFPADLSGVTAQFDLGLDAQVWRNLSLYAVGGYQTDFDVDRVYDAKVGFKIRW